MTVLAMGISPMGMALSLATFMAVVWAPKVRRRHVVGLVLALVVSSAVLYAEGDLVMNCPRWPEMSEWERWLCLAIGYCDCFAN